MPSRVDAAAKKSLTSSRVQPYLNMELLNTSQRLQHIDVERTSPQMRLETVIRTGLDCDSNAFRLGLFSITDSLVDVITIESRK